MAREGVESDGATRERDGTVTPPRGRGCGGRRRGIEGSAGEDNEEVEIKEEGIGDGDDVEEKEEVTEEEKRER